MAGWHPVLWVDHSLFIHGHLDGFHVLTIMKSGAVDTHE